MKILNVRIEKFFIGKVFWCILEIYKFSYKYELKFGSSNVSIVSLNIKHYITPIWLVLNRLKLYEYVEKLFNYNKPLNYLYNPIKIT